MNEIIFSIWVFLPAALANMTPIPVSKVPFLKKFNYPADFYKTYKGVRIFGDHKTIRGYISGIIVAILTVVVQINLYESSEYLQNISPVNYSEVNPIILGTLAGFGALFGDSVKSFFKRRRGIAPGKTWVPFDQIDYIVGGLLFMSLYLMIPWYDYLFILITYFLIHLLSTSFGYLIGVKDSPI